MTYHQHLLTIKHASKLLKTNKITSKDLALYCYNIAKFTEEHLHLNSFSHVVDKDLVIAQADRSDSRRGRGRDSGVLDGIPISIKGNIAVKGFGLYAGSDILGYNDDNNLDDNNNNNNTCNYNSFVAHRLLNECNSVLIGITTMDEFGMGSLGTNIPTTPNNDTTSTAATKNPLSRNLLASFWKIVHQNVRGNLCGGEDVGVDRIQLYLMQHPDEVLDLFQSSFGEVDSQNIPSDVDDEDDDEGWLCTGGSSSGSAVSISFGSSLLSIGTDTGGSVRLPSSWTGIVGFKPTYGLISRHGLVEYASSLDTVGILAPSVNCCSIALCALTKDVGYDGAADAAAAVGLKEEYYHDSTSVPSSSSNQSCPIISSSEDNDKPLTGITVGVPKAFLLKEYPIEITSTWEHSLTLLQKAGADIVTIDETTLSPTYVQYALPAYYILACAEASSNLCRYDGIRFGASTPKNATCNTIEAFRTAYLGDEVIRRILCGNAVLSSDRYHTYYESAAKIRALLSQQIHSLFHAPNDTQLHHDTNVHVLLTPTTVSLPPPLGKGLDSTLVMANDVLTVPFSLAGIPAISVPVTVPNHHSDTTDINVVGMQILASRLDEFHVLRVASVLEQCNSLWNADADADAF